MLEELNLEAVGCGDDWLELTRSEDDTTWQEDSGLGAGIIALKDACGTEDIIWLEDSELGIGNRQR